MHPNTFIKVRHKLLRFYRKQKKRSQEHIYQIDKECRREVFSLANDKIPLEEVTENDGEIDINSLAIHLTRKSHIPTMYLV